MMGRKRDGVPADERVGDLSASAFLIGLLFIVGVGTAIRFYGLSEQPVWMDEAHTYFASRRPLIDILFNRIDNHPPLFYAVQHFWTLINPAITAVRVPVAAMGSATILIVALATADLINRRAALAAAAFLALSTGHIYFSQDARMYSQLTLGLALATWGALGFVNGKNHIAYLVLYLVGAAIAIYSQVVALPYLAILNFLAIVCLFVEGKRTGLLSALVVNLILLVLCLPWLLSLPEAIDTFEGLGQQTIRMSVKFIRDLIGFPGVRPPFNFAADAFILLLYVSGAILAWKNGWRTFVLIVLGLLVLYPLTLNALSLFTPILASRVFIPCTILASMLFGAALMSLRRPLMQTPLLTAVLLIGVWSEVEAARLRTSPEDVPQVLAIADDRGFTRAPILACYILPAATAHLYAPDREVVFLGGKKDEFIRFNARMPEAFSLPMKDRIQYGASMRDFLAENNLFTDPKVAWASYERIILVTTNCWANKVRFLEKYLGDIGFRKIGAPDLKRPERSIIEPMWTEFSLWSRSEESAQRSGP